MPEPKVVEFDVPLTPVGKARARITRKGNYTPLETKAFMNLVGIQANLAMRGLDLMTGPLWMMAEFYFPKSKSWSQKKKDAAYYHTKTPDLDNIEKSIEDACNGIVYKDDCAIAMHSTAKYHTDRAIGFCRIIFRPAPENHRIITPPWEETS